MRTLTAQADLEHSQYFIRGTSIALDKSLLAGVNKQSIAAVRESTSSRTLRELRLNDFEKEPDSLFASVVLNLPALQVLVLRYFLSSVRKEYSCLTGS